jgi:hypothetical protein
MSKLGTIGAAALALTLAVATPALARDGGGGHVGGGAGGGAHFGGGAGGANFGGGSAGVRGAQASIGGGNFAGRNGGNFAGRSAGNGQFSQRGEDRDRGGRRGFGRGFGFGLAAGSALGYGYGGGYYDGDYAYNDGYYDGGYYDGGSPDYVVSSSSDSSYCAQRYRSYDPASGTYLGYDGLRHPCE